MNTQTFTRRGQHYEVIAQRAHARRDGTPTTVYELRTACRVCDAEFVCTAGPADMRERTRYLTRRCPSCRPKRSPRRPKCPTCGQWMPEARE